MYIEIQSNWNTPPSARSVRPGGRIQFTGSPPLADSQTSRANPENFPLSFTEKIKITFLVSRTAKLILDSLAGGVDQTLLDLESSTFSSLLLFIIKNLASRRIKLSFVDGSVNQSHI
jgi:hypothetical protein